MPNSIYLRILGSAEPGKGHVAVHLVAMHALECPRHRAGSDESCTCGADQLWQKFTAAAGDQPWRWLAANLLLIQTAADPEGEP
jgi:hypothetical protein